MIKDKNGKDAYSLSSDVYNLSQRLSEKIMHEDAMVLGIIWGHVGSGKSLFAQHLGYAIDDGLHVDRICFDKQEFTHAVIDSRKQVIIADEGISLVFSRASMTKEGRLMSELLAQMRQKNLCVLICVPELLSVDWLVLKQANFVAYVWESTKSINSRKVSTKGNVAMYPSITGDDYMTRITHYLKTKKRNPYAKVARPEPWCQQPGNPIGKSFSLPFYPVDEEAYRAKKESILTKYLPQVKEESKPKERPQSAKKRMRMKLISDAKQRHPELTDGQIAKVLSIRRETVSILRREAASVKNGANKEDI